MKIKFSTKNGSYLIDGNKLTGDGSLGPISFTIKKYGTRVNGIFQEGKIIPEGSARFETTCKQLICTSKVIEVHEEV